MSCAWQTVIVITLTTWFDLPGGKTVLMDLFYSTLQLPAAGSALFTDHAAASQQSVASTLSNLPATTASAGAATSPSTSTTSAPPPQLQPRPSSLKRRLHFHEFMLAVHQRLHALQTSRPKQVARSRLGLPVYRYADSQEDPLDRVVMEVAADTQVLCLVGECMQRSAQQSSSGPQGAVVTDVRSPRAPPG